LAVACFYVLFPLRVRVRGWNDFAFVYAAGKTWLSGRSPYDFERWNAQWAAIRPPETVVSQPMPFMYPPHWAPLAFALAGLPWPVASRIWDVVNVAAHGATIALSLRMMGGPWRDALRRPAVWVFVALASLNPAVRYATWQSQTSVFVVLGIVGAFWAWHEKRRGWLVVFAFIAALKPQLSLLALAYLFANGAHVGVLLAGLAAALVGLCAMLPHLSSFSQDYAHGYALHMQIAFNDPKNFSNLLALFDWSSTRHGFMPASTFSAMAAGLVVTLARRVDAPRPISALENPLWQLAFVSAISGALMPLHGYDLVVYTPVVMLAYELRDSWVSAALVAAVLFAGRPAFVEAHLHVAQASSYLTTAVLLTLVAALGIRWQTERAPRGRAEVAVRA
jgi:hypothetical protein